MNKTENIEVNGTVDKPRGNGMFIVRLDNGHDVLCHLTGKMRKMKIRIEPGDRVQIELSPYDLSKGIIKWRL